MSWGSKQTVTQLTALDNTWTDLIADLGLNPRELAQIQVVADNEGGTVTDALEVRVLATLDDATHTYDATPVQSFSFQPSSVNAEAISFLLSGYYRVKVQVRSAGATDTYTVDGAYRLDGVSA